MDINHFMLYTGAMAQQKSETIVALLTVFKTQRQLALGLGISERYVGDLVYGRAKVPPWMDHLAHFARTLPPPNWPERWKR